MNHIAAMKCGPRAALALDRDQTHFWHFANRLIRYEAQTPFRLHVLGSARVSVACYGNLRTSAPDVPPNLIAEPGHIPIGPHLAAALARHPITIDVANPAFVNGYSHKPILGLASGGFLLVNRKRDSILAIH